MPRPIKQGLDYFPLDVSMDDEVELLEARHGIVGFGVLIKLYQAIYKNGYFLDADNDRVLLFSRRVNVDINEVNNIINSAVAWGLFNEKIFTEYQVLTSAGVQKRYAEATKRRKEVCFFKEYLLISPETIYPETVNVGINKINVNINSIDSNKSTQRKGKERKEEESIPFEQIVDKLNDATGKAYRPNGTKTMGFISARWGEGFRLEDFFKVIEIKSSEWIGTDMEKFLRPETVFGTKFESYLNQKGNGNGKTKPKQDDGPQLPYINDDMFKSGDS